MILNAFDVKFHEKKMRYPPGSVDPQKVEKKNNVQDVDLKT